MVELAHGVRRVARAHQLLGGLGLGRAPVQPAAAGVVRRARPARAVVTDTRRPYVRNRSRTPGGRAGPAGTGDGIQLLSRWVAWRRDLCSHVCTNVARSASSARPATSRSPCATSCATTCSTRCGRTATPGPGLHGFDDTVDPAARARPARRPRRRAARRARPGQDPAAAHAGRPARRVDAGDRRLRARRAPLRPDHAARRGAAADELGDDAAGRVAAPRRAVRREARHARTPASPT